MTRNRQYLTVRKTSGEWNCYSLKRINPGLLRETPIEGSNNKKKRGPRQETLKKEKKEEEGKRTEGTGGDSFDNLSHGRDPLRIVKVGRRTNV